jgi:hypothetical protein
LWFDLTYNKFWSAYHGVKGTAYMKDRVVERRYHHEVVEERSGAVNWRENFPYGKIR